MSTMDETADCSSQDAEGGDGEHGATSQGEADSSATKSHDGDDDGRHGTAVDRQPGERGDRGASDDNNDNQNHREDGIESANSTDLGTVNEDENEDGETVDDTHQHHQQHHQQQQQQHATTKETNADLRPPPYPPQTAATMATMATAAIADAASVPLPPSPLQSPSRRIVSTTSGPFNAVLPSITSQRRQSRLSMRRSQRFSRVPSIRALGGKSSLSPIPGTATAVEGSAPDDQKHHVGMGKTQRLAQSTFLGDDAALTAEKTTLSIRKSSEQRYNDIQQQVVEGQLEASPPSMEDRPPAASAPGAYFHRHRAYASTASLISPQCDSTIKSPQQPQRQGGDAGRESALLDVDLDDDLEEEVRSDLQLSDLSHHATRPKSMAPRVRLNHIPDDNSSITMSTFDQLPRPPVNHNDEDDEDEDETATSLSQYMAASVNAAISAPAPAPLPLEEGEQPVPLLATVSTGTSASAATVFSTDSSAVSTTAAVLSMTEHLDIMQMSEPDMHLGEQETSQEDARRGVPAVLAEHVLSAEEMRNAIRQEIATENQQVVPLDDDVIVAEPLFLDQAVGEAAAKRKWMRISIVLLIILILVGVIVGVVLSRRSSDGGTQASNIDANGGTFAPTRMPSASPTQPPTITSSLRPSLAPSIAPTGVPSHPPSSVPSHQPSSEPSQQPSVPPSRAPSDNPTVSSMPSESPTYSFDQTDAFFNLLELLLPTLQQPPTLVDSKALQDPSSIPHRTLNWMANGGNRNLMSLMQNNAEDNIPLILQYYAVVTLYWSLNGQSWVQTGRFLFVPDLCIWRNDFVIVSCDAQSRVTVLNFRANGMSGTIDPGVYLLSDLETFAFSDAAIGGTISTYINHLSSLTSLSLVKLDMDGAVPSEIGLMSNLKELEILDTAITGPLPTEIGNCGNLTSLYIQRTEITGQIPSEIGNLAALEHLFLGSNELTGQIPSELGLLTSLTDLWLDDNNLIGSMPPELGRAVKLDTMSLGGNALTGRIPTTIGNLTALEWLSLAANGGITGSIPTEIGLMTELSHLSLNSVRLTGTVPSEMGNLVQLQAFYMSSGSQNGSYPIELTNLKNLTTFWVIWNGITGDLDPILCNPPNRSNNFAADCLDRGSRIPKVTCTCCSICF